MYMYTHTPMSTHNTHTHTHVPTARLENPGTPSPWDHQTLARLCQPASA